VTCLAGPGRVCRLTMALSRAEPYLGSAAALPRAKRTTAGALSATAARVAGKAPSKEPQNPAARMIIGNGDSDRNRKRRGRAASPVGRGLFVCPATCSPSVQLGRTAGRPPSHGGPPNRRTTAHPPRLAASTPSTACQRPATFHFHRRRRRRRRLLL